MCYYYHSDLVVQALADVYLGAAQIVATFDVSSFATVASYLRADDDGDGLFVCARAHLIRRNERQTDNHGT